MSAPRPRADILVVGQGLAGTWLAVELERAGIPFAIADDGHARAASLAAAGIINPITGRRLVKSWRIDAWLPIARAGYLRLTEQIGVPLWRDLRIQRRFADERERRVLAEKRARGELRPFAGADLPDGDGFWIEGAARVDLPALLAAAQARWQAGGQWRPGPVGPLAEQVRHYELVVDCRGLAGARAPEFAFVPWEFSQGETLALAVAGLPPDEIVNDGHWLLPMSPDSAWVGATHLPGVTDPAPTAAGRASLEASARGLLRGRAFDVTAHRAGVRVNLPDKRPVVGRHPAEPRLGVFNGLGAKGALQAPALARQWVHHLTEGVPFDAEVEVSRFFSRSAVSASSR